MLLLPDRRWRYFPSSSSSFEGPLAVLHVDPLLRLQQQVHVVGVADGEILAGKKKKFVR